MPQTFTDIGIAVIFIAALVLAWRVGDKDDPAWEERWRSLSSADRARLTAAARSGALLASQEEIDLAAGFARRDQRRRGPYALLAAIRLPLGIALVLGGLLADSIVLLAFGVIFLAAGLWSLVADARVSRAERETISRARGL